MNYLESSQEENDELMEMLAEMHLHNHHSQHSSRVSFSDEEVDDSITPNNDAQREQLSGTTDNIAFPSGSLYAELIQFQRQHSIDGSEEDVASVLSVATATSSDENHQICMARTTSRSVATSFSRPRRQSAPALTASDQYLFPSTTPRRASSASNTPGRSIFRPPVSRNYFRVRGLGLGEGDSEVQEENEADNNNKSSQKNLRLFWSQHDRKCRPATDVVLHHPRSSPNSASSASAAATTSITSLHQVDSSAHSNSPQAMPILVRGGSTRKTLLLSPSQQHHNPEGRYISYRTTGTFRGESSSSIPPATSHDRYNSLHHHHAANRHRHNDEKSDEALARRLQEEFDGHHQRQHSRLAGAEDAIYNHHHHHQSSVGTRRRWDDDYFSPTRSSSTNALPVSAIRMMMPDNGHHCQFQPVQGYDDDSKAASCTFATQMVRQDILETQRQEEQRLQQERQDFHYALGVAKMQHQRCGGRHNKNCGNDHGQLEDAPPPRLSYNSSIGTATTVSLTDQDSSSDSFAQAPGTYAMDGWVREPQL